MYIIFISGYFFCFVFVVFPCKEKRALISAHSIGTFFAARHSQRPSSEFGRLRVSSVRAFRSLSPTGRRQPYCLLAADGNSRSRLTPVLTVSIINWTDIHICFHPRICCVVPRVLIAVIANRERGILLRGVRHQSRQTGVFSCFECGCACRQRANQRVNNTSADS